VQQNHGKITVATATGAGTIFGIYLPRFDEEPVAARPDHAQPLSQGRGETILLVEDEEVVRQMAGEVLELQAGRFEAIPVLLSTKPWNPPGSDAPAAAPEFAGPFGIRGEIQLWVEANSGVPLRIQGSLPAGPINIDIDIRLEQHAGTPAGFAPAGFAAVSSTLPSRSSSAAIRWIRRSGSISRSSFSRLAASPSWMSAISRRIPARTSAKVRPPNTELR
jgi:hypothetical protein